MNKYLIIGLIISFASIALVFALTFDVSTIERIREIDPKWFLMAILLHVLSWVVWGLRIKVMCRYMNEEMNLGLRESISIALSNLFLAAVTPSSIGGEPVRVHLLSKRGFGVGESTAMVVGERIFDAIFIAVSLPIAFFILNTYIENRTMRLALFAGMILFVIGIALFVYMVLHPTFMRRFIKFIIRKIKMGRFEEKMERILGKIDGFVESFQRGAREIFSLRRKSAIAMILAITSIYWLLEFLIPSCILKGLGQDPVVLQSISAQVLLVVMSIIPISPGGSGIAEGGAALLYSFLVPNRSILGVFILGWRSATYYLNVVVGGIFQHKIFK